MSAVVGRRDIMDTVHAAGIGGTFGGNPLACAAALAVMDIFEEEKLLDQAKNLGTRLQSRLLAFQQEYELIGDVRGLGPMMAMELVTDREQKTPAGHEANALIKYCFDRGLVLMGCGTYGNVIRLMMPLVISDAQLEKGLEIIYDGLAFVQNNCPAINRTSE